MAKLDLFSGQQPFNIFLLFKKQNRKFCEINLHRFHKVTSLPASTFCFCLISCSYTESVGGVHYTTSAKQNKGVQELFLDLSKSMYMYVRYCSEGLHVDTLGILDSSGSTASPASNPFETKSTQANSRRSIIVEEDLKATQRNNGDRGSSGGGCC